MQSQDQTEKPGGETIAIIPARGGSKGVPRKNVLPVAGVPLIARAVRSALGAGIETVYVSTDDDEIAAVAAGAGAQVIARPADIAGDTATSESAILHALDTIEAQGTPVSTVVFIQATSPFIPSAGVAEGVALVSSGAFDCAFSAYETFGFLWGQSAGGTAEAINHDASYRPRRQDREPHYLETGAFYVFDAAGFRAARHRFFGRVAIVQVPENSALEIDTREQFTMAGAVAHLIEQPERIDVDAIVTDFDGVHTDDTAHVMQDGTEAVTVSRSDGMGVEMLRRAGVPLLILSKETNPVVTARAKKLGVDVLQCVEDKASALRAWADAEGVDLERVAYLGNDINDLSPMRAVGWPIAVADATPEVTTTARILLAHAGGRGAIRELAERVLAAREPDPGLNPGLG